MTPHDEERLRAIRERFENRDLGVFADIPYLTEELVPRLVAEIARLNGIVDQITAVRFSPIGDNHHNAAVYPYCRGEVQEQLAAARRSTLLEAADCLNEHDDDCEFSGDGCLEECEAELRRRAEEKTDPCGYI